MCVYKHSYSLRIVASRADVTVQIEGPCERTHKCTYINIIQTSNMNMHITDIVCIKCVSTHTLVTCESSPLQQM